MHLGFRGGGFEAGSDTYGEIGEIKYQFARMNDLRGRVPEPESIEDFERMSNPISSSILVGLSVMDAYERVSNLGLRLDWTVGVEKMDYEKGKMNRVGTKHQCVVRGDLLDFETVSADFGPQKMVYGERFVNPPIVKDVAVFTLLEAEGDGTRIHQEFHYHKKAFPLSLLTPIFGFFARRQLKKSLGLFEDYAEKLVTEQAVS